MIDAWPPGKFKVKMKDYALQESTPAPQGTNFRILYLSARKQGLH